MIDNSHIPLNRGFRNWWLSKAPYLSRQVYRTILIGAIYVTAYVVLDWISFIYPFEKLEITPWNPPPATSLVLLLLLRDFRWVPMLFIASFAADLIARQLPAPLAPTVITDVAEAIIYASSAWVMCNVVKIRSDLQNFRDVVGFLVCIMVAAFLMAIAYVETFAVAGLIPSQEVPYLIFKYWVGDAIGVSITAPFILVHRNIFRKKPPFRFKLDWEIIGQIFITALALRLLFFHTFPGVNHVFYALFIPIIWVAIRRGLSGVTAALFFTQLAIILLMIVLGVNGIQATKIQSLVLVLSTTSLLLGSVVSEREQTKKAIARLEQMSRNMLTEKMTAALAHELNQPLSAVIGYTATCRMMLETLPDVPPNILELIGKASVQAERAGNIISKIREFFRNANANTENIGVNDIIKGVLPLVINQSDGIIIEVDISLNLVVAVDRLQIEQVLLNLIRNSFDALSGLEGSVEKRIRIAAQLSDRGYAMITIRDNGPGIASDISGSLFQPFVTSRTTGMGLGLAISRSIVESQGGKMWNEPILNGGAVFHFTLPLAS